MESPTQAQPSSLPSRTSVHDAGTASTGRTEHARLNTTDDDPDVEEIEVPIEDSELEDIDIEVVSATKTPQRVEEAPSIISVVTRREIQLMGYRNLTELLRNQVGFGINDNGHWPDTGVRGINEPVTYGDKLQMLIDGHNMSWRQFNRNYHNPSWTAMEDIERIEIIRGPGGALWGANALNGVVNIVLRDWTSLDGAEVTYGLGHRLSHQFVSARVGQKLGEVSLYGSVSYYEDDADHLLAPIREIELLTGDRQFVNGDEENGITINLKAKYKWFSLWFHKSRHDTNAPLSTFSILGGDDSRFVTDRHILRARYQQMIINGLELTAELDFDDYRFADGTQYEGNPGGPPGGDPVTGGPGRFLRKMAAVDRRYEGRLIARWIPSLKFQMLLGSELEYLDITRWYFPEVWRAQGIDKPEFDNLHLGNYVQAQYTPVELLALTAGTRLDYDEVYGLAVSPRAAAVLRLPAGVHVKALFGSAFKAPSFHDLYYYRKNAFYGYPGLDPERSYTGEGELGFRAARWLNLRVVGFYTRIEDLIAYTSRTPDTPLDDENAFPESQRPDASSDYNQKANTSHVTTMGVEAETWIHPIDRLELRIQGTYRVPKDDEGKRLLYSSRWTAGGSITLKIHTHLRATFRGLAVGNKMVPARGFTGAGFPNWTAAEDPTLEVDPYFVGTVVIWAENLFNRGLDLHLKLDNIGNLEYWDAGRDVLYPQRGFQGMLWATIAM